MTHKSRVTSVITAALAVPLLLSGCGPSREQFNDEIRVSVVASDPIIEDAFVASSAGLAGMSPHVRIYVTSTESEDLLRAVEAALRAILTAAPTRPAGMAISVAEAPMPTNPSILSNSFDWEDIARDLGLYEGFFADGTISSITDDFEERYGDWEDLRE